MTKPLGKLLMFCIAVTAGSTVHAHGGGLNSEGCHNRRTGDYHCHRGTAAAASRPARAPLFQDGLPRNHLTPGGGSADRAFRNCSAARAAGAAPVRRGDPGYGSHLDRDNDGIGCE